MLSGSGGLEYTETRHPRGKRRDGTHRTTERKNPPSTADGKRYTRHSSWPQEASRRRRPLKKEVELGRERRGGKRLARARASKGVKRQSSRGEG